MKKPNERQQFIVCMIVALYVEATHLLYTAIPHLAGFNVFVYAFLGGGLAYFVWKSIEYTLSDKD